MRPAVSEPENPRASILEGALRLTGGFSDADRPWVLDALSTLAPHLSRWDPAGMTVDVSVKHRGGKEQVVMLRAELPGYPQLVAKAVDRDLERALAAAKRELVQQIEDEKQKRDPKSNRLLRKKAT
jgi:ribosome-associated translation inhibitor RaiA